MGQFLWQCEGVSCKLALSAFSASAGDRRDVGCESLVLLGYFDSVPARRATGVPFLVVLLAESESRLEPAALSLS